MRRKEKKGRADDAWRAGEMELCGVVVSGGGGGCDVSRRSAVTCVLHSAPLCSFSAVIKEMFMLWMIQRRRRKESTVQYATLHYTLHSISASSRPLSNSFSPSLPLPHVSIFPCPSLVLLLPDLFLAQSVAVLCGSAV